MAPTAYPPRTGLTARAVADLAASEDATHVIALDDTTSTFYRTSPVGRVEFAVATYDRARAGWRLGPWIPRTISVIPVSAGRVAA